MTDHDEPDDRSLTSQPALQYPTLTHDNPTSSSNSQAEQMTSAFSDERPPSSLSESWTTLSASDIQSEDETRSELTDAAYLVGRTVPDDVASLDDHDINSEAESVVDSTCSEDQEHLPHASHDYDSAASSTLTERTAFYNDSAVVEFEEPDYWPPSGTTIVKCTLRVFDDETAPPEFLCDLPSDGPLTVNVRQTMSKRSLDPEKPFRILYVGDGENRQFVLDKLGDALAAGCKETYFNNGKQVESRFHVIPTSFGEQADPSYAELVPLRIQLVLQECYATTSTTTPDGYNTIELSICGQAYCSSIGHEEGYDIASSSSWEPPDVAVFVISDNENLFEKRKRQLVQEFAKRHHIPAVVISQSPIWGNPDGMAPSDYAGLHICVEYSDASTGETKVAGEYPIDLATFESIDAGQLNRHLASIRRPFMVWPSPSPKWFGPAWKSVASHIMDDRKQQAIGRCFTYDTVMRVLITCCCLFLFFAFTTLLFFPDPCITETGPSMLLQFCPSRRVSESTTPSSQTAKNIVGSSLMPAPLSDVALSACANQHSMSIDDYLEQLTRPGAQPGNHSDKFQLHALGDCHIIIQPPTRSSFRKRPVEFEVKVTRGEERLPYSLSKLFNEVYSLRLAQEHAYGTLNVSITTTTKPIFEQVKELDFGRPWLRLANWKKVARDIHSHVFEEMNAAQTGLSVIYGRISTDLQVMSDNLRNEVQVVRQGSVQRALTTTNSMVSKSKRLSREFKREAEKRMATSTGLLLRRYELANREAFELANVAISSIQRHAKKAREDFRRLPGKFPTRKPRSLAMAQKHAQKLVDEARRGWREARESWRKSSFECTKSSCRRR